MSSLAMQLTILLAIVWVNMAEKCIKDANDQPEKGFYNTKQPTEKYYRDLVDCTFKARSNCSFCEGSGKFNCDKELYQCTSWTKWIALGACITVLSIGIAIGIAICICSSRSGTNSVVVVTSSPSNPAPAPMSVTAPLYPAPVPVYGPPLSAYAQPPVYAAYGHPPPPYGRAPLYGHPPPAVPVYPQRPGAPVYPHGPGAPVYPQGPPALMYSAPAGPPAPELQDPSADPQTQANSNEESEQ